MPSKPLTPLSQKLRRNLTDAERTLWFAINRDQLGHKFRRQVPIGPYIVDFAALGAKVVLEIDGGQHLDSATDPARDAWLNQLVSRATAMQPSAFTMISRTALGRFADKRPA